MTKERFEELALNDLIELSLLTTFRPLTSLTPDMVERTASDLRSIARNLEHLLNVYEMENRK